MRTRKFILLANSSVLTDEMSKVTKREINLLKHFVYPDSLLHEGRCRSLMEIVNRHYHGAYFAEAEPGLRRLMLNQSHLPAFNGPYLQAFLGSRGLKCEVVNYFYSELDRFTALYKSEPDPPIVGISATLHLDWTSLCSVTEILRQIDPDMHIISGGAFYRNLDSRGDKPEQWEAQLSKLGAKAVFFTMNSEFDLAEYLAGAQSDAELEKIPNLAWFDGRGRFRVNPVKWHEPLLSGVPCQWRLDDLPFVKSTIQLRTSVGCPYSCAFCRFRVLAGRYQELNLSDVEATLDAAIAAIPKLRRVFFIDDALNSNPARFQAVCALLGKKNLDWFALMHSNFITAPIARLMRDSGCRGVYLGVESGSEQVLRTMNKHSKPSLTARGINYLRREGILTFGSFIVGFPGETEATVRETENFLTDSGLDYYRIQRYLFFPETMPPDLINQYALKGGRTKWSHSTMNSTEATAHVEDLFKRIKSPVYQQDTMWGTVNFIEAGFNLEEIKKLHVLMNSMVADQIDGQLDDPHPKMGELRAIVLSVKMRIEGATDAAAH